MSKSLFDSLNHFIQKRHRWVIIAWVAAVLISLALIPSFFSAVSYDLTGGFGAPANTESVKAANLVQAQFPSSSNSSSNAILIVLQGVPVYSDSLKQSILTLDHTISQDKNIANYTGESSLYSLEANLLNSSLPAILSQTASLQQNIESINSGIYTLQDNLSTLSTNLFAMQEGVNQTAQLVNLTIANLAASIPEDLSSELGASPTSVLNQLYNFGQNPSNATLANYAITLMENSYANQTSTDTGFPVSDLIQSSYQLGNLPNATQTWDLACTLISSATQNAFVQSPLYTVNSTSLNSLLEILSPNETEADINNAINNLVSTQSYANYPCLASQSLTSNFVNSKNDTMLVIMSFSSNPEENTITHVESDVQNSSLPNFGKVYVTGGPVLTKDVAAAFLPALEITIGPGIGISLLIVALLFLAPLAALIPILLGGVSVSVALASIYVAVVGVGHGTLTFLTPTLTILLMLGLAVDYSVLQLRRTREERQKGKTIEESVGTSLKWAGQAVLTAGITVIVAYIVMAVANVPLFSDVGTAIALGVSILLLASLTLLPALEIALGDKIFWPGLNRQGKAKSDPKQSRLRRLAHGTLRRKVPIVIIISVVALSAFVLVYKTPTSEDFLKLIPNFQSNQGLTALANGFGTGSTEPTSIIITTPTPIIYGNNQFNQTLLYQIEQITDAAAGSAGVNSVSSPTRPFGNTFDYGAISNMSEAISIQYESQMLSAIGKDNKTAEITVGLANSASTPSAMNSLREVQKNINSLSLMNGINVYYGGTTQSAIDSQTFMGNLIPEVVAILAVAVYVILFFQLRSAFTPLRLIATILCSVIFSLAIVSLLFNSALNLPILDFAPLFVVVTMLGVGIDYDIFFLTRIREEVLNGKTDNEAIMTAIDKVWVTILGLGLVLATVFASLIITNIAILQEISLAVAAAILIDVTIVILFFVPSLMGLAQKFNWWPYKIYRSDKPENNTE